jgi:hypothetical protein
VTGNNPGGDPIICPFYHSGQPVVAGRTPRIATIHGLALAAAMAQ